MDTILIILGVVAVAAGVVIYLVKKGKIADSDGDLIPDVVEDAVDDVKETAKEVKKRAKRVAEEAKDVVDAVKEVVEQSKDVVEAAKGDKRKGRKSNKVTKSSLRGMRKADLISIAKKEFNVEFDSSLTKTNLINKVYELYNKK
jgi:hypothetical protein